jgi:hypothetical protein
MKIVADIALAETAKVKKSRPLTGIFDVLAMAGLGLNVLTTTYRTVIAFINNREAVIDGGQGERMGKLMTGMKEFLVAIVEAVLGQLPTTSPVGNGTVPADVNTNTSLAPGLTDGIFDIVLAVTSALMSGQVPFPDLGAFRTSLEINPPKPIVAPVEVAPSTTPAAPKPTPPLRL